MHLPVSSMNFIDSFDNLAEQVITTAREKGWITDGEIPNDGEGIALMHSELSEALEALRKPETRASEKIPQYSEVEEELADVIIRLMHFARVRHLRVAEAVIDKMAYNDTRSFKHGGKKF